MRLVLLFSILLLPHLLLAQIMPRKVSGVGYYTLPTLGTVFTTELSFVLYEMQVVVKDSHDNRIKFTPSQVSAFTVEKRRFVAINNIALKEKYRGIPKSLFAEQLDSGQLAIYKLHAMNAGHYYTIPVTPVFENTFDIYLINSSSEPIYTVIPDDKMGGKKDTQEKLFPYFTARPDLLKVLQAKGPTSVITDNLLAIIHAFNTGQPYSLPLTHYEQGKQQMADKKAQKIKQSALAADSTK